MQLDIPHSAILSAVIFNALIIVVLIPLALRGVKFRAMGAAAVLRRNLLIYGVGGLIAPVHRDQAHRPRHLGARHLGVTAIMRRQLLPALRDAARAHGALRAPLPARRHRRRSRAFQHQGRRLAREGNGQGRRLLAARPELHRRRTTSTPVPPRPTDISPDVGTSGASNLGPTNPDLLSTVGATRCRLPSSQRARRRRRGAGRRGDSVRLRTRPPHLRRQRRAPGAARRRGPRPAGRDGPRARSRHTDGRTLGCSASRA